MSRTMPDVKDWRFSIDRDGIAWAVFDRERKSANALGQRPLEELGAIVATVEEAARTREAVGLVIISGKERGFIVGADINEFEALTTEAEVLAALAPVNALWRRIEALPVPVVAAIHGVCVGGGLELALACHYRIATRDDSTQIGFPEVKLGIFPGWNGTFRSIGLAGGIAAMRAMLTGGMIRASVAKAQGFIDELVASPGALRWAARKAVLQNRRAKPARAPRSLARRWPARSFFAGRMRTETRKRVREDHYPAPFRLIDLFETHGGDDTALAAHESKAFASLLISAQSRNLRRVFRLSEALKAQAPKKDLGWKPQRVHVIGAGTMGAGIAGACVAAGMEVTLQDVSPEQTARGMADQGRMFAKKFKTKAQRDAAKTRFIADPMGAGLGRADVVIEAIVENLEIKQRLLKDIEGKLKPGAVLATNTSSLKIEDIAAGLADPARLIGLHFFSPVAMMPLVEVVRGAASRETDVLKGAAFVVAIGKFPLVVKSAPGFLVNRILAPYMTAAMARVEAGEDKERIDAAARNFGMPMGPIELADSVGLDICANVGRILRLAGHEGETQLDRLVREGKLGKKSGEGFYVWKKDKPVKSKAVFDEAELAVYGEQLLMPLVAEAERCRDEGIVASADLIDAGVIFGTGFAPFRGGPLHDKAQRAAMPIPEVPASASGKEPVET